MRTPRGAVDNGHGAHVFQHLFEFPVRLLSLHKLAALAQDFLGSAMLIALVRNHGHGVQIARGLEKMSGGICAKGRRCSFTAW